MLYFLLRPYTLVLILFSIPNYCFVQGVERTRFDYSVYLLNKNIAQLRWHCDESTPDLRTTLRNLDGLLGLLTTREALSSPSAIRLNLPLAPPVLSGVATVLSRGTPPGASRTLSDIETSKDLTSSEPNDTDLDCDHSHCFPPGGSDSSDCSAHVSPESSETKLETVQTVLVPSSRLLDIYNENQVEQILSVKRLIDDETEEKLVIETRSIAEHEDDRVEVNSSESSSNVTEERSVEIGVAADMFWDSVTSRAQVLSVPASFKTNKQKTFRQF